MRNESGLKPLGHAVLVEHYEPERKESVIVMPETVEQRTAMVEQRAVVIEVGPACWPNEAPRAKPGDKVLISRLSGCYAKGTADGKPYRFVNDMDIFAQIERESEHG